MDLVPDRHPGGSHIVGSDIGGRHVGGSGTGIVAGSTVFCDTHQPWPPTVALLW